MGRPRWSEPRRRALVELHVAQRDLPGVSRSPRLVLVERVAILVERRAIVIAGDRVEPAERIVGVGVAQPSATVAQVDVDKEIAAVVVPELSKAGGLAP